MSPATEVYLCDKVADHGKGKPCRKLVEGGGIQVEIAAAALPLETDETSAVIYRQFHNAADAQHWLRRISVKDLLAVEDEAIPHFATLIPADEAAFKEFSNALESKTGNPGVPEQDGSGTEDAKRPKARPR